jgi:S-adenosylmethionine:tRNA ribosyltransferase-isomerase
MQHPGSLRIEDFTYELPDDRIAKYPLQDRDTSKLLVYRGGDISESVYRNIAEYIPQGSLLVFNQTKVVNARLLFKKDTGSVIEVFCLEPHAQYADVQTAMLQKGKVWWECMIGGAGKWKDGIVLNIAHSDPDFILRASIVERRQGAFTLELSWDGDYTFAEVLHYTGKVPLPPYLNRQAEVKDEATYQTIYAKEEGSVAAPTAGLHFTEHIFQSFEQKQIDKTFVTLHVGAGTFKPVKTETIEEHDMHAEWIEVDIETIDKLLQHAATGIVAVGTTSLRTLESLYWIGAKLLQGMAPDIQGLAVKQWDPYELKTDASAQAALRALKDWMLQNNLTRLVTRTQILIAPGYTFRIIKGLVTNFHQPQSTLLLLVSALIGDDWRRVYEHAMQHDFRFLSYGDGCLLLP